MHNRPNNFDIPAVVQVGPGRGAMTAITVTTPLARAEIYLHGAQVTQFQPIGEEPLLWLSSQAVFDPAKAIRGGVPICFPWFGAKVDDNLAPAHGFARLAEWDVEDIWQEPEGVVVVVLAWGSSAATVNLWPAQFTAKMTITIATALDMCLEISNPSHEAIWFEEALHTYLMVSDVRKVTIEGLGGTHYKDALDEGTVKTQQASLIDFSGETDRVYLDAPQICVLHDPGMGRRIEVRTEGARDAVVWNPWIAKAQRIGDFADAEWPRMVCIETANVAGHGINLAAGAAHTMSASLRVVK